MLDLNIQLLIKKKQKLKIIALFNKTHISHKLSKERKSENKYQFNIKKKLRFLSLDLKELLKIS